MSLHSFVSKWKTFFAKWWKIVVTLAIIVIVSLPVTWFSFFRSPDTNKTPKPADTADQDKDAIEAEIPLPETTPPPVTSPPPPPPKPPPAPTPHSVLGLTNWKLALPINTAHAGNPDEIKQPELASFSSVPYFYLNSAKNGVIFQAHVGGATTTNSNYPRSELREMTNSGKTEAAWSSSAGTHTMTIRQAITHTPAVKREVVAGQIHDGSDDVIMVRLNGSLLYVEADGEDVGTLDANYALGNTFTVKIEASGGNIRVFYNGVQKVEVSRSGSGYFFKAGCYTQSNTSKGDAPDDYGQVIIYSLQVVHS